ncbi:hypothetical protein ABENE_20645 [Asticcacaulis benevestitus DSM 16100 = ATCC BAA-896]|uniref:Uncharacterized protein n=2 Tax=Asticcacaulis TaxID=76890 RepID=V4NLW7_9CAUL|nr:hypothetical protein ABENE_20645 [Asticcacaulis benevestitus DSM 16100 = ATCC BAA-896]
MATAVASSLALHGLLVFCLLLSPLSDLKGNAGRSEGSVGIGDGMSAITVQIVTVPQMIDKAKVPQDVTVDGAVDETHTSMSETFARPDMSATKTDTPPASQSEVAGHVNLEDAKPNAAANLSGGAAPGVIDGHLTLLQQIARCLPPNVRPDLSPAHLRLAVALNGTLSAVPMLTVDVASLDRDQLREANQIIQASLQCGPYSLGGDQNAAEIDVPADFTVLNNPAS